jgi:hypothetical protein
LRESSGKMKVGIIENVDVKFRYSRTRGPRMDQASEDVTTHTNQGILCLKLITRIRKEEKT